MSRELIINRLDVKKDGTAVIRESGDHFICGRTNFTNEIAQLFYDRKAECLVVDYPKESGKLRVECEDPAWSEREFDLEFAAVDKAAVDKICADGIEEDDAELERENAMLNDACIARRNARTVKDFREFSELIDELREHIGGYREQAKLYADYMRTLDLSRDDKTESSYILLTLSE